MLRRLVGSAPSALLRARPAALRTCIPAALAGSVRHQHLIPNPSKDLTQDELASAEDNGGLLRFLMREGKWHDVKDKVAIRCSTNGFKGLTYGELEGRISAAAHALRAQGFEQGDCINLHLHNCEQFIVAFFATAALGGRVSTSNPVYTAAELANQQIDAGCKFVISSHAYDDVIGAAVAKSQITNVSFVEDATCFANAPATDLPLPPLLRPIDPREDIVALPYSSGTTGRPKGVMLTHHNMTTNTLQCRGGVDVERDDVLVGVLPLFHIYGMTVLMMYSLMRQAELVLLAKFDPQPFLEALSQQRVTVGFLVPPIILFLAKHPLVQQYDLSALRYIFSGAAPLDGATQQTLSEQLGIPLLQGWGMTELSPIGTVSPYDKPTVNGSAGALVGSTEGMIVDPETGASLPPGAEGELLIRGPQVMKGYLGRADATAETIRPDGFLRTGDLAYHDDAGNVFLVDRLKELIKVKGLQVAPAEIEGRLLEIEELADAAVIGIPDERAGQLPKAYCVKKPDAAISEEAVRERLSATLAPYKIPAQIEFIDAIPKSASGKILRRHLMAQSTAQAA